jgi:hypothetical protein
VALLGVVAACGGSGDAGEERASRRAAATTTPAASAGEVGDSTVEVGKTFWFAGFKVTVRTATLQNRDARGGAGAPVVTIAATFENVGDDRARFDDDLVLQSRGRSHFRPGPGHEPPEVPSGVTADGTVEIVVDPTFRFDDAVLVVGGADVNQARVPLGRSGTMAAHEPRPVALSGRMETPALTVDLRGGELRSDQPRFHRQVESGRRALVVNFNQTVSGCRPNFSTLTYNLDLVRPDGTTANAEDTGDFGKADNFVVFLVPEPPGGKYTLRLDGKVGGSTGPSCPARFSAETTFVL